MIDTTTTEADAVATIARAALDIDAREVDPNQPLIIERLRHDEHVQVTSLEAHLEQPLRARGTATLHEPADFAEYVNRLKLTQCTTLWADLDRSTVTAVLDDHATYSDPGWRSHTVALALKVDPDWQAWANYDGKLIPQDRFAEFLEETAHTVISPDAATMLEVATTFRAKRSADFSSSTRLQSGDVQFAYSEDTKASAGRKGSLEVPERFTVRVTPWIGVQPVELTARLRYRIDGEGRLGIGFALLRPDLAKRRAFAEIIASLREAIDGVPLLTGTAPEAIRPQQ